MKTLEHKTFTGTPFSIDTTQVENAPGTWNSTKVTIFRDDIVIGEYIRNYHSMGTKTFCPFLASDGNWYALYSSHYTSTRVLRLHDDRIEDWCGEQPHSLGFCPTEYFVPKYHTYKSTYSSDGNNREFEYFVTNTEYKDDNKFKESKEQGFVSEQFCDFGFMSGCVWGDDSSWKLRYIDLSSVPDKVVKIEEKFGYWELPSELPLRECINMSNWEPSHNWIELVGMKRVDLKTGQWG